MFGGYGIFKEDLMVGSVADEVLLLKIDQETIPAYEENGLWPLGV
jgi:TfoX/Sxy family transcriptional regulator of competence genes